MLSTSVLTRCDPAPGEENDRVIAAVHCTTARTGPAKRPLVMRFASGEALRDWLTSQSEGLSSDGCGNGDSTGTWKHKNVPIGTLVCKPGSDGAYLAMWTFDADDIAVIAEAADRRTIYTWWTKNAYLITRTVTPSPTPSSATLDAEQQALADQIKSSVLTGCTATPDEENDRVIAALNCTAVRKGPLKRPLVMRFADEDTLKTWLASQSEGLPSAGCTSGDSVRPWNHEGTRKGTLVCKPGSKGNYRTIWTFDDAAVAVIAEAADRRTIRNWWAKNANLLTD
jgi:hypothetical protein